MNGTLLRMSNHQRFTHDEDQVLIKLAKYRVLTWNEIAEYLPGRTGNQCRDRYNQYLYKEIEYRPWTEFEDNLIVSKYKEIGPHWVEISKYLPGRNGTNIKNRFATLKRRRNNQQIKNNDNEISDSIWEEFLSFEDCTDYICQ